MKRAIHSGDWVRSVAMITGGLTCALGVMVILGWIFHSAFLVQLHPEFVPMQFNTALGFFLAGAGLIAATHGIRRVALGCGTAVAALGLLTLFEYLTGIGLAIDQLFFTHDITVKTSHPGRMAPNAATAFAASGIALALIVRSTWPTYRPYIVAFWGSVLVFAGTLSFLGYVLDVETAYGWGELTPMALHTAAGFVLLGTGIFVFAWREGTNDEKSPSPLAFHRRRFLFLGLIMAFTVSVVLSTALYLLYEAAFAQQAARLHKMAEDHANHIVAETRFHEGFGPGSPTGAALTTAINEIRDKQGGFATFGETGVTRLAKLEGNQIKYLLGDRHDRAQHPPSVPLSSGMAQAMREALRGKSGTRVGPDGTGTTVLAGYHPVGTFGLGVVTRIDLAEIRAPFIRAGMTAGGTGILLVALGTLLFRRFGHPLLRHLEESEHKYRALFDNASEGVFLLSGDVFLECNEQACRLWACNRADIIGRSPLDFSPLRQPDGRRSVEAIREILESLASGKHQLFRWKHRRKDGVDIDAEIDLRTIEIEGREFILATMRDITRQEEMFQTLRLQGAALEAAANAIVITDRNGDITWVNAAFTDLTGYPAEEAVGRNPRMLKSGKQDEQTYKSLWDTIQGGGIWHGELINRRKDASLYTEEQTITPLRDPGGQITHFIAIKHDITARKRAERQIREITFYDSLTGLPNRRMFHERLQRVLRSAKHRQKLPALISINLDRLKGINDAFGRSAGDQLLREVTDRLVASLRTGDYITKSGLEVEGVSISRMGGDEFIVLLSDITDSRNAATVAGRLLESLSRKFTIVGQSVFLTASIGISVFPHDGEDPDTLARNAETAMHAAKNQGGNGWQYYTASMNAAAAREIEIETGLRGALERQEFSIHYQPLRDAVGGKLLGAEALLRWTDPETGPVSPAEFIPVAEKTGLIVPIGEQVLQTTCAQIRAWQDAGFRPFRLAVNVSAYQFRQGSVAETVERILGETGLSPAHLELELTESALVQNDHRTVADLNRLHDMGIGLALDDFGTGFSSLAYLRKFPFDRVKIDRSFVAEIDVIPDDARLVAAIIAMAHRLGLQTVAEGVETLAQAEFLRLEGCNELQGYLFSPPVPPEKFVRFLEKEKEDVDE